MIETTTLPQATSVSFPKVNMQLVLLALVAVITIFQTIQLMILSYKIGTGSITSTSQAPANALPKMQGGC